MPVASAGRLICISPFCKTVTFVAVKLNLGFSLKSSPVTSNVVELCAWVKLLSPL